MCNPRTLTLTQARHQLLAWEGENREIHSQLTHQTVIQTFSTMALCTHLVPICLIPSRAQGKALEEVLADGLEKLASVPSGGAVAAAPAAVCSPC